MKDAPRPHTQQERIPRNGQRHNGTGDAHAVACAVLVQGGMNGVHHLNSQAIDKSIGYDVRKALNREMTNILTRAFPGFMLRGLLPISDPLNPSSRLKVSKQLKHDCKSLGWTHGHSRRPVQWPARDCVMALHRRDQTMRFTNTWYGDVSLVKWIHSMPGQEITTIDCKQASEWSASMWFIVTHCHTATSLTWQSSQSMAKLIDWLNEHTALIPHHH